MSDLEKNDPVSGNVRQARYFGLSDRAGAIFRAAQKRR